MFDTVVQYDKRNCECNPKFRRGYEGELQNPVCVCLIHVYVLKKSARCSLPGLILRHADSRDLVHLQFILVEVLFFLNEDRMASLLLRTCRSSEIFLKFRDVSVQNRYLSVFAPGQARKQLIVVGTGWGGYSVLRNVDKKLFDVIVVSPRNHFLFTPLLASTTVGTLEFRSIIEPVRNAGFRNDHHFHLSEAVGVDSARNILHCRNVLDASNIRDYELKYDHLVIACGAMPNTFGTPGVEEHAFFLKVGSSSCL